ncbi:MAG: class I SAM-dependent methyltransferase [Vicinamibacterales bacterium]
MERSWNVAGFAQSRPNDVLLRVATDELVRCPGSRLLDVGCGAGRNAIPLARLGWHVFGLDLSWPMTTAAAARGHDADLVGSLQVALAPMDCLPVRSASVDLVVAHGIWNLAPTDTTFGRALGEAARVAKSGAALCVFTFSRHTLPDGAQPVSGAQFVFTQFSGQPQCFLTEAQLIAELEAVGFAREPGAPLTEYKRTPAHAIVKPTAPVIYDGVFRRRVAR